jgi:hypothetical protein
MGSELAELVKDGFYRDNVERMANLAEGLVATNPSLYGPLFLFFRLLYDDLDPQASPRARIESLNIALERPILDLLAVQDGTDRQFIERMDEVMRTVLALL